MRPSAQPMPMFLLLPPNPPCVPFEVGERQQRVVTGQVAAYRHLVEPFSSLYGQCEGIFFVDDIDGAKSPAVYLQGLSVLFGSVAVALVVGVGLNDMGLGQLIFNQLFYPFPRDDVRPVGFARVQFHAYAPGHVGAHLFVGFDKTFGAEVASEVDYRLIACAAFVGHILVAVW